jgi:hypothetical protein
MPATPTDERKAIHEAGHAVVGIAVGLTARRLFMNPQAGTTRGAGVDFVPTPDGTFVLEKPVEQRRAICLRLIAQFAAGYLAERLFLGGRYDPWVDGPDGDLSDVLNKAVWGVATLDDQGVIDGTTPFETWTRKPDVDRLIEEGEKLAIQLLKDLEPAVREIADIAQRVRGVPGPTLHAIVERVMRERGIEKVI